MLEEEQRTILRFGDGTRESSILIYEAVRVELFCVITLRQTEIYIIPCIEYVTHIDTLITVHGPRSNDEIALLDWRCVIGYQTFGRHIVPLGMK